MTLKDLTPAWMSDGGIFKALHTQSPDTEWLASYDVLDIEYYGNRSGDKRASPLVESIGAAYADTAAKILLYRYGSRWQKLWEAGKLEYKPLENYNSIETETPNLTKTRTPNLISETKRATDMTTDGTSSGDSAIFGFNSASEVPQASAGGTSMQHVTGDKEKNGETVSSTGTETESETGTIRRERSGNIGVTTSQQMLQSELDLWKNWDFVEQVYKDVDTVLTCPLYE